VFRNFTLAIIQPLSHIDITLFYHGFLPQNSKSQHFWRNLPQQILRTGSIAGRFYRQIRDQTNSQK
jgi:hypothetical protein